MSDSYQKLFSRLAEPDVPADLSARIIARIESRGRLAARFRVVLCALGSIGSAFFFASAFFSVQQSFADSGFGQFFSLMFTDFEVVAMYWKNFLLTLAEAVPTTGLIVFLGSFLVLISLIKLLAREAGSSALRLKHNH